MKPRKIIIPNLECCSAEEYQQVIDMLDSLPLNYEVWYKDDD